MSFRLRRCVLVRVVHRGDAHERAAREAVIDTETHEGASHAAIFMPGPMELIIVLGMVGLMAIFIVVMIAVLRLGSSSRGNDNLAPCPDCGRLVSIRATTNRLL